MGTDVKLIAVGTVGNRFQIVMGDRVSVGIGHEIGKCFLFPVEKVQSAALGADPDIIVFIFRHMPDKRETDAVFPCFVCRINSEKVHFRIEIVDATVISTQPDASLPVFVNRENGGVGEASGKVVAGIYLEMIVIGIIFV